MSRSRVTLLVALMVAALGLTTTVAQAQTYPGTSVPTTATTATTVTPTTPTTPTIPGTQPTVPGTQPTIPPSTGPIAVVGGSLLLPGGPGSINVAGSFFIAGIAYDGVARSTPFALPATVAGAGQITWKVVLPSDFELNATHTLTARNISTGATASTTFYVDCHGRIGGSNAGCGGRGLPKTGSSNTGDLVKGGAALVALGGVILLATKRRKAAPTA